MHTLTNIAVPNDRYTLMCARLCGYVKVVLLFIKLSVLYKLVAVTDVPPKTCSMMFVSDWQLACNQFACWTNNALCCNVHEIVVHLWFQCSKEADPVKAKYSIRQYRTKTSAWDCYAQQSPFCLYKWVCVTDVICYSCQHIPLDFIGKQQYDSYNRCSWEHKSTASFKSCRWISVDVSFVSSVRCTFSF